MRRQYKFRPNKLPFDFFNTPPEIQSARTLESTTFHKYMKKIHQIEQ